ncbi:hypothetical protein [Saccharolobus caldissimus]|uniref:Uncharacterized protein n=1 Tax=Saccharolobus caldissimus TaxID=1702097 RepID=A0AAQ4CPS1_9CREN|nr:hypothetical protein [Saccharolobus caldissimus]BDB97802.1 hypothetical protein SACC_08190 [Saccharolobus caldissimus]
MNIDDIIKVASEYPYKNLGDNVKLEDQFLNLEQLPQLLNISGVKNVIWKYKAKIIGPDLSIIKTATEKENDTELLIRTPVNKISIPWIFNKINQKVLRKLVEYLIPCKEGTSLFNISAWERYYFRDNSIIELKEGEVGDGRSLKDNINMKIEDKATVIDTGFFNPQFSYINPYYIQISDKLPENTYGISIELDGAFSIVSDSILTLDFKLGKIKAESNGKILVIKTKTTAEAKLHRLLWDITNNVIELDCKPPFPLSIYRIEPSSVIPLYINFNEKMGILDMIIENFSEKPVIATLYLASRISKIIEPKNISSLEYDRIRVPIRRWGILHISLEIKRLPDLLLKRKAI